MGFSVGYVGTTALNQSQEAVQSTASRLPEGHPDISNQVDVEKEVRAAIEFGRQNLDYESQLRVGSFLYMEAQRLEEAKPFFLKAHELRPNEFEPLRQLGNVTFNLSQHKNDPELMKEAAKWYEKALKIKPDDINVRTDYGITFFLRQPPDYKSAIAQYDKSLQINPEHAPTLYNKLRAQIALGEITEALTTFEKLKSASPEQQELIRHAQAELENAKGNKIPTH